MKYILKKRGREVKTKVLLTKKLTTYEKIFLLFTGFLSILIFVHYVQKNMYLNFGDEDGYLRLSSQILNNGLFSLSEPLRTYMYPLLIALFRFICHGNTVYTKILFSVFQYIVYIYTIIFIANTAWSMKPKRIIFYPIIFLGALNPYLIQSATLFLTDCLSSCFIVFSVLFAAKSNLNKGFNIFVTVGFLFIDLMIRPSNAIFFAPAGIILLFRLYKRELKLSLKVLVVGFSQLLFLIPQLYNNVVHLHRWTPLIVQNLYKDQTIWSVQYLKYGTVMISGEKPQLYYTNPFHVGGSTSIYQLAHENFGVFLYTIFSHIFGVIDWGYVDSYINNFYSISRILGSVILYISWAIILAGIVVGIRGFFKHDLKTGDGNERFILSSLLLTAIVYSCFISTTCVESRFGYPIFLLLLIFSGWGGDFLFHQIRDSKTIRGKSFKAAGYLILFSVFVLFMFYLSYRFDLTTGRINWPNFIRIFSDK